MNTPKTLVITSMTFAAFASATFANAATEAMTAEQHIATAQQYEARAATANQKAAAHETMARHTFAKGSRQSMENHCGRLIAQYRAEADAYAAKAAEHRAAAK